jgi:hypothetical protein
MDPTALLLINTLATWFMLGLVVFVQGVHYPLFSYLSKAEISHYMAQHRERTTWVVALPMLLEAITTLLLLYYPPAGVTGAWLLWGAGLLMGIWLLTALTSIPSHNRLSRSFNRQAHQVLLWGNAGRALLWALRGGLMAGCQLHHCGHVQ